MIYTAALAGNPNSGKTTLFNLLTGSDQHVGNWSGVTVEKKEGSFHIGQDEIRLVDLPGIYSLSPRSMEEIIARDFICREKPDIIINIADGTNLERNLYLSLQLAELEIPMLLAINMWDELKKSGTETDCDGLARELGMKIVPISAKKNIGTDGLLRAVADLCKSGHAGSCGMYADLPVYDRIERIIRGNTAQLRRHYVSRILEGDENCFSELKLTPEQQRQIKEAVNDFCGRPGDSQTALAEARYKYIQGLIRIYTVSKNSDSFTRAVDGIVTNKYLAIPIFILIILGAFLIIFGRPGNAVRDMLSGFIHTHIAGGAEAALQSAGAPDWCVSLVSDGIIGGVGAVVCFLPQIILLFLFLTLLEDSGYMARAAFITDGLMSKIGLSGKAFIPMLMGFGCSVPAVMAARTADSQTEKQLTVMLIPFMSCSARMPIYALFAGALFPQGQGPIIFSLYLLGIAAAALSGLLLKKTVFRQSNPSFLLELPPYRIPEAKGLARHLWYKCRDFLLRAGTLIFGMSIIIWVLQSFTPSLAPAGTPQDSLLGAIGSFIAPVFAPLGFGFWQASVSLLAGLVAKESVVAALTVLCGGSGGEALTAVLPSLFTPASAYSFMTFALLYTPCIAAIGAIKQELGSWRRTAAGILFQTLVAYLSAFAVFRIASLF